VYIHPLKKLKKNKNGASSQSTTEATFNQTNFWCIYSHFCELRFHFTEYGHLYAKVGHSIHWNALHEDAYKFFLYIDQHPGNNCVLFIDNNLQTDTCLQLKKITRAVFLFQLLQFVYEVWEMIVYFTTCFSFWRLFYIDFLQRI